MRRLLASAVAAALTATACSGDTVLDTAVAPAATSAPSEMATTTTAPTGPAPAPFTTPSVRGAEAIYFVMIDRFANGDPANDRGGSESDDPLVHGFLPTAKGFYHGGDLAGLESRLDYIAGLGVDAIWITPPFRNKPVQGRGALENSSAGYHGYWIVDFTQVDPHFGTNDDMREFIDAARERGFKVYFDIVVNHTADVITYEEGSFSYRSLKFAPYLDASGVEFDPADYAGTGEFPDLDPAVSFAYTPVFPTEADAMAKHPEWLNDLTLYHNRGNSNFTGENIEYGDFFGLDDLFTEHPAVVTGMSEIYAAVIEEFGVDGFRIDTAKHVNDEFWLDFLPAILSTADSEGIDQFFAFGEVAGADPIFNSRYVTRIGFPSVLDFGFSSAVGTFVSGRAGAKVLADHFDDDDWFTGPHRDAGSLVTFVGNHDVGRVANLVRIDNPSADDDEVLRRVALAFELLFTSRGVPTLYYGDEQGFVGDGGDQDARQSMFPSSVDTYNDDDLIGTDLTTADDNFDTDHPLYELVSELTALRAEHPALAIGSHHARHHDVKEGVFAFSRIHDGIEYLVVTSNGERDQTVDFDVATPASGFEPIYGPGAAVASGGTGAIEVMAPGLSTTVYRARNPVPGTDLVSLRITRPGPGDVVELSRFRLEAEAEGIGEVAVAFAVSIDGGTSMPLGTDWAAPYRVYWDSSDYQDGTTVELTVTAYTPTGRELITTSVVFELGDRG